MRAVDVGDEMNLKMIGIRLQSLCHHQRAEVRATDADVDDVSDRLARVPGQKEKLHKKLK